MRNVSTCNVVFFGLGVMVLVAIAAACYVDSCPAAKAAWLGIPRAEQRQVVRGTASWYSTAECHAPTASGERLRDDAYTAAMWDVPFGTRLRVAHGSRSVVVRVNDRGPAKRLVAKGRIIDLSKSAFGALAPLSRGVIPVEVTEVRP